MILRAALCLILAVPASANAAPVDRARAASVLAAAARAMGRLAPDSVLEAQGIIEAEGRSGQYDALVRAGDGAFVQRNAYALFAEAEGYDGRSHWRQERSGGTHPLNAPFARADGVTQAWLKRRGYLRPGSARLEAVAQETIGGQPATVLTLRPPSGNNARLAFDDATHVLVRVQTDHPTSTITESYSDYRRVGSAMAPFRVGIEESGDLQSIRVNHYTRLAGAARGRFAAPGPPADTAIAGPATIPLDGAVFAVIPARINGHAYDFILDTGGHNILTPAVAAALGLTAEGSGSSGGSGAGRAAQSDTRVQRLELGSATLTDQHFYVIDMGNAVIRTGRPPMAGILGLEIFERMIVTIDEPRGRLTLAPSRPGQHCEGDRIPLLFSDDQPTVRGTIDGTPGLIGIDTGNAGTAILFWRWAEAHDLAARYRNGRERTGSGVGGNNTTWQTPHHEIVIGRSALHDLDANYSESRAGAFSSRADAANLGHALLRNFVVTFDYANAEMCLRPATLRSAV
jgi:hypothetical protein